MHGGGRVPCIREVGEESSKLNFDCIIYYQRGGRCVSIITTPICRLVCLPPAPTRPAQLTFLPAHTTPETTRGRMCNNWEQYWHTRQTEEGAGDTPGPGGRTGEMN